MSKISGQLLISGQFQDNCETSGQLGALQKKPKRRSPARGMNFCFILRLIAMLQTAVIK